MATTAFTRVLLSGSTQGRGIKITQTSTPGDTIHTTGVSASVIDEIWIWVYNSDSSDHAVTIELGGTTAPDDNITLTVPSLTGQICVVNGAQLSGNGSAGLTVKAFAASANKLVATGYVNRMS